MNFFPKFCFDRFYFFLNKFFSSLSKILSFC
ncbi:Uncharacterised protein [Klebsiella pneumoniae]|nr:Uncharacterised protein [Klebsiella pneumoniae]